MRPPLATGRSRRSVGTRSDASVRQALLAALSARDAAAATKAITALSRDERSDFLVLAYALYHEARSLGLAVGVPHKYAF